MLHEIFKGMDNASEAIDENFKNLSLEYGSNENGEWIRIPILGLQYCWKRKIATGLKTTTSVNDKYFRSETISWEYPMSFSEVPLVEPSVEKKSNYTIFVGNDGSNTETTSQNFRILSSHPDSIGDLSAHAFGKYK